MTACEQAGSAGFVVQLQGSELDCLSDAEEFSMTYHFAHDRYREAILGKLDPEMRRILHGRLAAALFARFGETEEVSPLLAEHHYGAAEYEKAAHYALLVADAAYRAGNHERAAEHYQIAIDSAERNDRMASVAMDVRDRYAQSLAAIGKSAESNAQLKRLLEYSGLSPLKSLDYQHRLAESYFREQDHKHAVAPLLAVLDKVGERIPISNLSRIPLILKSVLALFIKGPLKWPINRRPPIDPAREALIMRTLAILVECTILLDAMQSLTLSCRAFQKAMDDGLGVFSAPWFGAMSFLAASQGLDRLSGYYEELTMELLPQLFVQTPESGGTAANPLLAQQMDNQSVIATLHLCLLVAKLLRGPLLGQESARYSLYIRQGLAATHRAADLWRACILRIAAAHYLFYTGNIASAATLWQAMLNLARRYHLKRVDVQYSAVMEGYLHCVSGRWSQAHAAFRSTSYLSEPSGAALTSTTTARFIWPRWPCGPLSKAGNRSV